MYLAADVLQKIEPAEPKNLTPFLRLFYKLPTHLEVKTSGIANAGMGLYAARYISEGKKIGKYKGITMYGMPHGWPREKKAYLVNLQPEGGGYYAVRDGHKMSNHMRWANHKKFAGATHEEDCNAWLYVAEDKVVYMKALRDIEKGEEIFIDYGYDPTEPDSSDPEDVNEIKSF
ncbi:MAG: SET domain-containing protein [Candidatus Competibacteraceae bacterium]|nr:SET domain-containing protein [Candidatus Competibacteraceae bacterium]